MPLKTIYINYILANVYLGELKNLKRNTNFLSYYELTQKYLQFIIL